jgi:hypothetical protein
MNRIESQAGWGNTTTTTMPVVGVSLPPPGTYNNETEATAGFFPGEQGGEARGGKGHHPLGCRGRGNPHRGGQIRRVGLKRRRKKMLATTISRFESLFLVIVLFSFSLFIHTSSSMTRVAGAATSTTHTNQSRSAVTSSIYNVQASRN